MQLNNHKIKIKRADCRSSKVKSHPERSRRVTVVHPINNWIQFYFSVNPQGILHYYRLTEKVIKFIKSMILLYILETRGYVKLKNFKKISF